eukprot:1801393-Pleurochrysis_carterae.AAC.1
MRRRDATAWMLGRRSAAVRRGGSATSVLGRRKHGGASARCDGLGARQEERGGAPRWFGGFGARKMKHG